MTDDRGAAALAERLHAVEDPHLADVSLRQKRLAAAILGRNRRMPLTHQHQLDKLPRPDPLAEALPGRRTDLVRRWQRLDATNAEMSDYMRRHLDAAGYVVVRKEEVEEVHQQASHWFAEAAWLRAEVRPKLTAERLAWALALHTEQPTIEWWDPETMNLVEMTWAEFAAAILAALAAEADDA